MILLFLCVNSQSPISALTDSLVVTKNKSKIVDLSLKIANQLKTENFARSQYYISLARTNTEKLNDTAAWKFFYDKAKKIYFDIDALDLFQETLLAE